MVKIWRKEKYIRKEGFTKTQVSKDKGRNKKNIDRRE